ncbi:cystathionine beta-lyase [Parapusillimonas sp. JC17]|uniref:cystathionine beta-lyase n=1 Tax=Parapusillimonas sp. JC17 TaxID=3445768 RepID=UPI003F9FB50D
MQLSTLLVHAGRDSDSRKGMVNTPVYRTSTVVFDSMADYRATRGSKFDNVRYGRLGTYTTKELEHLIASLENAYRAVLTPSGVSAITTTLNALALPGSHILVPDNVYFPCREYCEKVLRARGVEVEFYTGSNIASLTRPNTAVVYCESPGSLTMEMQDIKALADAAHEAGAKVVADNTWATPIFFSPFEHGIDVSIHAATKYLGGHSDVMMGTIATVDPDLWLQIRSEAAVQGLAISPDDAYLMARGIRTLGVRMERHYKNGVAMAQWLMAQPKVETVLYPALESSPDHALWQRQMSGASGLMTMALKPCSQEQCDRFIDALSLFSIGASWGGYESLVLPADTAGKRSIASDPYRGPLVRLHIGLENIEDLQADLRQAFEVLD